MFNLPTLASPTLDPKDMHLSFYPFRMSQNHLAYEAACAIHTSLSFQGYGLLNHASLTSIYRHLNKS